eukprot:jgi/Galph1/3623/GphlegSOOS_G2287.1
MATVDPSELLLIQGIQNSLKCCLYSNAIFLAERLFAQRKSEETAYLLATACIREKKLQRASAVLSEFQSSENRYLAAWCFYEQNKLREAEESLKWNEKEEDIPGKAAGHYLLGLIYQRSNRRNKAIDQYQKSLEKDPTLWMAFVALCEMGSCPDPDLCFDRDEATFLNTEFQTEQIISTVGSGKESKMFVDLFTAPTGPDLRGSEKQVHFSPGSSSYEEEFKTPSFRPTPKRLPSLTRSSLSTGPLYTSTFDKSMEWQTPSPMSNAIGNMLRSNGPPSLRRNPKTLSTPSIQQESIGSVRKFGRLSFSNKTSERHATEQPMGVENDNFANFSVMKLFRIIGKAQLLLSLFCCEEAIQSLEKLPPVQYQTGYILSMIGRAYYELLDYNRSLQAFEQCQHLDWTYTDGLEYFSSVMWHLRMETELSFLAQYLLSVEKVVLPLGVPCLKRATQLSSRQSYAHALIGHEYILKEDYDAAMASFRTALAINEREYHAWYGLGQVFHKQEKYKLADYHYRCAIKINPRSSLLYYHLANALHASKACSEALNAYDKAVELNSKNYVARFERARLYSKMQRIKEATDELVELSNLVPKERMVLEAVMVCVDNSEWMRNGDYPPSRLDAQQDAANLVCGAKLQQNPENTVGLMTMAGGSPEILVTQTQDIGVVLSSLHGLRVRGNVDLKGSLLKGQLALKHRPNKVQRQRIIVFVGSCVDLSSEELVTLGRRLKKNNVAVDVISFGEIEANAEKLEAFIEAVNSNDNSHLLTVPPGPHLLSDIVLTCPIIQQEGTDMRGYNDANSSMGERTGGSSEFEFGVDPNIDPELAMALRISMEEEKARQETLSKQQEPASGSTTTTEASKNETTAMEADRELYEDNREQKHMEIDSSKQDDQKGKNDGQAEDEDEELRQALELSLQGTSESSKERHDKDA